MDVRADTSDDAPRMRVVSWNMGMGDRSRRFVRTHDQAWRYLLGLNPDLAFLQETLPPAWLESEGRVIRDPFAKWGSLIFSPTLAIEAFSLPEDSSLRALPKYLAFAEVPLPDDTQAIAASIHAPPRRAEGDILGGRDPAKLRRSVEGPKYNDAIFAGLAPLVEGRRFILAGDWNTARHQGTQRASRAGEEFLARVREAGWCDCVWAKRQDEIRTWFGPGSLQQDDYVFCDPSLGKSVQLVSVAEDATTERHLSDHAPLIVDFDIDPVRTRSGPSPLGGNIIQRQMTIQSVVHQPGEDSNPQHCKLCGTDLTGPVRAPFTPSQLALDEWDMEPTPPMFVRRIAVDATSRPANVPWCSDIPGIPWETSTPGAPPLGSA